MFLLTMKNPAHQLQKEMMCGEDGLLLVQKPEVC